MKYLKVNQEDIGKLIDALDEASGEARMDQSKLMMQLYSKLEVKE